MEHDNFFQDTILNMNPLLQDFSSENPMPHNQEILGTIFNLREVLHKQRRAGQLDQKGTQIATALDEFLKTSESFIRDKNPDEAIQKFIERCVLFGDTVKGEAEILKTQKEWKSKLAVEKLLEVVSHLKHIIQKMFSPCDTSRKLFKEVEVLIEECFFVGRKLSLDNKKLSQMSKDQRQRIIEDYLRLCSKIGNNSEWKDLYGDVVILCDYFIGEKGLVSSYLHREIQILVIDAIDLLNRFNERNIFKLKRMAEDAYRYTEKDEEVAEVFSSLRKWTEYLINHPKCIDDDLVVEKVDKTITHLIRVFEKYYESFSRVTEELKFVVRSIIADPFVKTYQDNINNVGESLKGSYLDTIVQLRTLMAPIISETLKNAKLPRMHEADSSGSWAVDNITMSGKMSHLDDVVLDFRIGLKNIIEVFLSVRQIDIVLKDVDFIYDRTSLPTFSDKGKLDVKIYSPGWRLKWVVNQKPGREAFFELADIDGNIKYLDIIITQANHSWIDSILVNMWIPSLKRRAERAIENMLAEKAAPLTEKLNRFFTSRQQHSGFVNPNPKVQEKMMDRKLSDSSSSSNAGEATQVNEKKFL